MAIELRPFVVGDIGISREWRPDGIAYTVYDDGKAVAAGGVMSSGFVWLDVTDWIRSHRIVAIKLMRKLLIDMSGALNLGVLKALSKNARLHEILGFHLIACDTPVPGVDYYERCIDATSSDMRIDTR